MGRKIPGRKHRGVKDLEKQNAERFAKIKDKINSPPINPDEQQVSKSLLRVIDLKNKAKKNVNNKRKNNRNGKVEGSRSASNVQVKRKKPNQRFKRLPGESDRQFKHRIDRICRSVIQEAAFEDKYNVNIKRNDKGQVEGVEKRPPDELDILRKQIRKDQKTKHKKGKLKSDAKGDEKRLTKSQKWAQKKANRKQTKLVQKHCDDFANPQFEQVQFGEVVHAPPVLTQPKKINKTEGAPRPGQKPLLLKSILNNGNRYNTDSSRVQQSKTDYPKVTKVIDKKGKRKNLPFALRRQLDSQQKEIVEAYKKLKTRKVSA